MIAPLLFLAGGPFRRFQRVYLLLFFRSRFLYMGRHRAIAFLPLLSRGRKTGTVFPCFKFDDPGATFALLNYCEAFSSTVRTPGFLHEQAFNTRF